MAEVGVSKAITESFFKAFLDALAVDVAIAGAGEDDSDWNWEDGLKEAWEIQDFLDGRA